jgi:hypothetical protein
LNFALGSYDEFHSCYESFRRAGQISEEAFERLDEVHYRVEIQLIKLIKILQKRQGNEGWQETFPQE